jgi:hypothetical protein
VDAYNKQWQEFSFRYNGFAALNDTNLAYQAVDALDGVNRTKLICRLVRRPG